MTKKTYPTLVWEKHVAQLKATGRSDVMESYRAFYPIDDDDPKNETDEAFIRRCALMDEEDGHHDGATFQILWDRVHATPYLRLVVDENGKTQVIAMFDNRSRKLKNGDFMEMATACKDSIPGSRLEAIVDDELLLGGEDISALSPIGMSVASFPAIV